MPQDDGLAQEGATDLRLWVRLLACAKIIEKGLRRKFQEQFDTTLPRFDVMAALERAEHSGSAGPLMGGLSMGDLSRALLVSNGNVTAIVRQLHEQGMVETRPDPKDGRSAIVSLTAQGRGHFADLALAHRGWVRAALADMPPLHQAQLAQLLGDLKSTLS